MKYISRSFIAMILLGVLATAQAPKNAGKVQLIEEGDGFHGNEIHARSGEKWLGLFVDKGRSFLAYTKVTVRRVNDPVHDEDPKQKTGKAVIIDRKTRSYFLVKGTSVLKPSEVTTVFAGRKFLENGDSLSMSLGQEQYTLKVVTKRADHKGPLAGDAKLIFSKGKTHQTLFSLNELPETDMDDAWELLWAGDLDQDGKLDLYINSLYYNGEEKWLFLSSLAGKGRLVRDLATFAIVGC